MKKRLTTALLAGAIITTAGCAGTAQQSATQAIEAPMTTEATTTTATEQETTTTAAAAEIALEESGRTELNLTDEEFRELIHKIFLVNQQETMFERHSSQSVVYINDFPASAEAAYAYYITPDSVYQESQDWIYYDKDRVEYQVDGISEPETASKVCLIDFQEDWESNLWRYVPTDESMWMNYEHDHLIDAYTEDGRLHILTRYDEEMSREYCENTVGVQYEGEIYTTDTICDENNYDLLAFVVRKELNGSSEVVNTILFEYDGEIPSSLLLLRMMFEQRDEEPVTVTIIVDPDTDREASKTITIPPHIGAAYVCDDMETIQVFTDRECTVPYVEPWDRMTDLTMYLKHTTA